MLPAPGAHPASLDAGTRADPLALAITVYLFAICHLTNKRHM
eukprot:CAMPEP_0202890432 /NCGR_PEP_ID=MMETSP1392-20130828/838_1 /ASSEMBLY_ACC=CAM_ASM_000868 /TAXON_ID=225041 /ORGANISM="Chlamydomonas chlamydogama, Strain SAG 11-48b" /LENGTH=41 /DNA_ID= /DNA_START= /DNA_END= /DNA_ORIENTATION=